MTVPSQMRAETSAVLFAQQLPVFVPKHPFTAAPSRSLSTVIRL